MGTSDRYPVAPSAYNLKLILGMKNLSLLMKILNSKDPEGDPWGTSTVMIWYGMVGVLNFINLKLASNYRQ